MSSETHNIITNIIPRLQSLGWVEDGFEYEVTCSAGQIDILYRHSGKNIAVIEAKRVGGNQTEALEQAKRYAKSSNTPLAIATDGASFLCAYHCRKDTPLLNHNGEEISMSDFASFTVSNLLHFVRNPSLRSRVKSEAELNVLFSQLNSSGRDAGLTSGVERLQEIAKLVFIKMLVDNHQYLDHAVWDSVMEERRERKISLLNHHIQTLNNEGIELEYIQIDNSKAAVVENIMEVLHHTDFNHKHYDANSTLFQNFLSERARGGGTNDLGQYFTPQKIIRLMVSLSDYKSGETVYDPFCGTAGVLCEFFTRQKITGDSAKKKFGRDFLFGSEISKPVANLAKMNMVLVGDGHSNILAVDSMIEQNKYMQNKKQFDHVVTNIPFDPKTPSDGVLRDYFALSHDASDVTNFVEHCINMCKLRGKIVLIVPRGFLTEKQSINFRKRLLLTYDVQAVYDLYSGIFAPYTPVRSCLFVINKTPPENGKTIDFFSIKDDDDIVIAANLHNSPSRHEKGYYKVFQEHILENDIHDLRGHVYETKNINPQTHCRIGDLVTYIHSRDTECRDAPLAGLKKMTTPNSIQDGFRLIESKSNRQVSKGYGSFVCELQRDAIVVSRITNERKKHARRYFGSSLVGNDDGHLITKEYYQFVPKNSEHIYYILYHLRTKQCQDIAEWASGTGGQQRIEVSLILNQPIPMPTPQGIKKAEKELHEIEQRLDSIKVAIQEIDELSGRIFNAV